MAFRLIWHDDAINDFRQAISYGKEMFGERVASLFANKIKAHADILTRMPYIGPQESFSVPLKHQYRSLSVHPRYKLIYFVDKTLHCIHIVAFWPTESNPKRLEEFLL